MTSYSSNSSLALYAKVSWYDSGGTSHTAMGKTTEIIQISHRMYKSPIRILVQTTKHYVILLQSLKPQWILTLVDIGFLYFSITYVSKVRTGILYVVYSCHLSGHLETVEMEN